MHLVADENLDSEIVAALRAAGHTVVAIAEVAPGTVDPRVLDIAREQNAILLTADKDFGELVFARGLAHAGVILIRLHGRTPEWKVDRVVSALRDLGEGAQGRFTVIEESTVRTSPTPG